ncbi:MAG: DUF1643 domain-containing protein [Campylobacterales bacterium]
MKSPYIGRQVKHFDKVQTESLVANFSECMKYRYTLDMEYSGDDRDKQMIIILKNPSSADEKMADKTIATAESYIYKHFLDVKKLRILNIYSYRATYPRDVAELIKEGREEYVIGLENDAHIDESLKLTDYVLIAWGGSSGIKANSYKKRVESILHRVKKSQKPTFRNPQKGSELYPFHACYWGYESKPCRLEFS